MKSFYHYLAESAKEYRYRVKTIVPIDEAFVKVVKETLFKYGVKEVSKPKKLMPQKNPLDFRDQDLVEVSILDIVLESAASSFILASSLRGTLRLLENQLVVRGENEPVEIEARAIEEIHKDSEYSAKLSDPMYEQEDQPKEVAYGDEYNKRLLDYLAQDKANNDNKEVPAIEEVKKKAKFSWLAPQDKTVADDFNAGIEAVKPVHSKSKKVGVTPKEASAAGHLGNYDETIKRKS